MKQVHEILSNVSDRKTDYGRALYEEFCSKYPTIEIPPDVDCRDNNQNTGAFLDFIMDFYQMLEK